MGRYDLANNKVPKKKQFVSPQDTIASDLENDVVPNGSITGAQTSIRGKNVMIRGPNGFQVSIPLRFVEMRIFHGENWIRIPSPVASNLRVDIQSAQLDPNERLRIGDLRDSHEEEEQRRRNEALPFG